MVNSQKVSDHQMLEVYENTKKAIQEKLAIPGEITISVLRETKVVKKIAISKKFAEKRLEFNKKQRYGKSKGRKNSTSASS
jgi:hypothetical protein